MRRHASRCLLKERQFVKKRLYSSVNTTLFKYSTAFKRTHSRKKEKKNKNVLQVINVSDRATRKSEIWRHSFFRYVCSLYSVHIKDFNIVYDDEERRN